MRLAVVTATLNMRQGIDCVMSWVSRAKTPYTLYSVWQIPEADAPIAHGWRILDDPATSPEGFGSCGYRVPTILGVVPAFAIGVQKALEDGADIIACLHDDLEILQEGWDQMVLDVFAKEPQVGLVGFGGGTGLADHDIYQTPYDPMQLARKDFVSNMRDAEAHGRRVTTTQRVACLDGFSQIGRREFWQGQVNPHAHIQTGKTYRAQQLFAIMEEWGVIHHFYDGMLGCFAKRLGWEVWMLPVRCHHYGGRTAVGDARYAEWASGQGGDAAFWQQAHRIGYHQFRDVLPIRI